MMYFHTICSGAIISFGTFVVMRVVSQCVRTVVGLHYVTTVSLLQFQCVLKHGLLSIPIKIFSEEHKIQWCTNTTFSINKLFYIVLSFYVLPFTMEEIPFSSAKDGAAESHPIRNYFVLE